MKRMIKRTEITIETFEITTIRRTPSGAVGEATIPDSALNTTLTLTRGEGALMDQAIDGAKDPRQIDHEPSTENRVQTKEY